jgi:hypothetical protein
MLAVARVHLIDQPNAKRLVFGVNVGGSTRDRCGECDARSKTLKRSHDYPL